MSIAVSFTRKDSTKNKEAAKALLRVSDDQHKNIVGECTHGLLFKGITWTLKGKYRRFAPTELWEEAQIKKGKTPLFRWANDKRKDRFHNTITSLASTKKRETIVLW